MCVFLYIYICISLCGRSDKGMILISELGLEHRLLKVSDGRHFTKPERKANM